jgi:spore coat polysaccharide biosynthesis predicted glycosyltransferase SpsG
MKSQSVNCLTHKTAASPFVEIPEGVRHPARTAKPKGNILWIRTAAGPSIGFGHLCRSLILARILREQLSPVFLLDADDQWSQPQIQRAGFNAVEFRPQGQFNGADPPVGLLIDTREKTGLSELVSEANQRAIPTISIHDLGLAMLPSDVLIDGSIAPNCCDARASRCYTGLPYLVLEPSFARYNSITKMPPERANKVVISLGGGDTSTYFPKILEALRQTELELDVIGVPGFLSWGQESLSGLNWQPLQFRWAEPEQNVADLMFECDMAITAGGLSAYEALCSGIPLCAFSYDRHQEIALRELCRAGACVDLGPGHSLGSNFLTSIFQLLAESYELRSRLSRRGREMIDGRGAERVAQIVYQSVLGDTYANPGDRNP